MYKVCISRFSLTQIIIQTVVKTATGTPGSAEGEGGEVSQQRSLGHSGGGLSGVIQISRMYEGHTVLYHRVIGKPT